MLIKNHRRLHGHGHLINIFHHEHGENHKNLSHLMSLHSSRRQRRTQTQSDLWLWNKSDSEEKLIWYSSIWQSESDNPIGKCARIHTLTHTFSALWFPDRYVTHCAHFSDFTVQRRFEKSLQQDIRRWLALPQCDCHHFHDHEMTPLHVRNDSHCCLAIWRYIKQAKLMVSWWSRMRCKSLLTCASHLCLNVHVQTQSSIQDCWSSFVFQHVPKHALPALLFFLLWPVFVTESYPLSNLLPVQWIQCSRGNLNRRSIGLHPELFSIFEHPTSVSQFHFRDSVVDLLYVTSRSWASETLHVNNLSRSCRRRAPGIIEDNLSWYSSYEL